MPINPESEDAFLDGQNLSAEARAVSKEAANAVKNWIDDRIKTITTEAKKDLDQAQKDLEAEWQAASNTLESSAANLKVLQQGLASLEFKLEGDLKASARNLHALTKAANEALEASKQAFRKGGEAAGKSLIKALAAL